MAFIVRARLALLSVVVTLLLTTSIAGAAALSVNTTTFRVAFTSLSFATGIVTIRCAVTLNGVIDRDIEKTRGLVVGAIIGGTLGRSCTEGSATLLRETLPWDLSYSSFTGTLPNITSVNLTSTRLGAQLSAFGVTCLYASTEAALSRVSINLSGSGQVTGLRMDESASIPKRSGIEWCPAAISMQGTGTVTKLESADAVVVRQIATEATSPLRVTPLYGWMPLGNDFSPYLFLTVKRPGTIRIGPQETSLFPFPVEFDLYVDTCEEVTITYEERGSCVLAGHYGGGNANRPTRGRIRVMFDYNGGNYEKDINLFAPDF